VKPAPFDYLLARSGDEALDALGRHGPDARVLAGGQSLVPLLNLRLARPAVVVDINGASELDTLTVTDGTLRVGALARLGALERWATGRAPLLAEVLRLTGHPAIRARGTVVGSLVHADPAAELPALLLCGGGAVRVRSRAGGERVVPAETLYVGPLTTSLRADELAVEATLPLPPPGTGWGFAEVARRHGDFALVGSVAWLRLDAQGRVGDARLVFFGVGGTPERGTAGEKLLLGQSPTPERLREAGRAAAATLRTEGDLHATADYRRRVAAVLAERTLGAAAGRCRSAL
jgi:aerobic carbon-monoxide dehydrogenase medium subunit